ncbi:hypothetical protein THAOC_37077 [Thalassiosira oceanica]|uniref:Uncharacterized protein n=1 Tax=Thalassiosira oceanica TaxID=159749 RepID=K0QZ81_THAOC|nr:hypothetical protein THAOC_37077 [Thalassiosira oceanica]|eukprot:EJK44385.1 hypothetical protein THAOC_37077 [Thalassiosira oceanica]
MFGLGNLDANWVGGFLIQRESGWPKTSGLGRMFKNSPTWPPPNYFGVATSFWWRERKKRRRRARLDRRPGSESGLLLGKFDGMEGVLKMVDESIYKPVFAWKNGATGVRSHDSGIQGYFLALPLVRLGPPMVGVAPPPEHQEAGAITYVSIKLIQWRPDPIRNGFVGFWICARPPFAKALQQPPEYYE